ncbi:hypothetical protein CRUP_023047 [Coryphaenoides rupestris]|nr:hypothetical protein CRUP_023047 [Coryphaenoides rupestris]
MQAWARSVFAGLMVVNSVASVAGNLLVLLLLLLHKDLRTTDSSALSLSLSLSDLGLGLTVLPLAAHRSLGGEGDQAPSGLGQEGDQAALCQAGGFLFLLLQTASLHSLAWLTLHRYSQICLPLSHSQLWTGRRTLAPPLLLWSFCLLTAALPLLGAGGGYAYSRYTFLCEPGAGGGFGLYLLLLGVLLPLGAVVILQACMAAAARRQARRGTFTCNQDHCFYVPAVSYTRTAGLLLTTSGVYQAVSGQQVWAELSCLSAWLLLCTPALNPWSISMSQTRYRAALRRGVAMVTQVFRRSGETSQSPPQSSAHSTDLANHSPATTSLQSKLPTSGPLALRDTQGPMAPDTLISLDVWGRRED